MSSQTEGFKGIVGPDLSKAQSENEFSFSRFCWNFFNFFQNWSFTEIIYCLITLPSATAPLHIESWKNILKEEIDISHWHVWHIICKIFQISCQCWVFREKISRTAKLQFKKLSLMSNIQVCLQSVLQSQLRWKTYWQFSKNPVYSQVYSWL